MTFYSQKNKHGGCKPPYFLQSIAEQGAQIFTVGDASLVQIATLRDGAFNLHPALIPNILDCFANPPEVHFSLAEQETIFLQMEFTNVLFAQPTNFFVNVVAPIIGV